MFYVKYVISRCDSGMKYNTAYVYIFSWQPINTPPGEFHISQSDVFPPKLSHTYGAD